VPGVLWDGETVPASLRDFLTLTLARPESRVLVAIANVAGDGVVWP